jgi:5-methylcytosine-specific restriction endonuclease McrA
MKKDERLKVFNKTNGRCAYCGNILEKGWHVDHKEPILRKMKEVKGYLTNEGQWVPSRYINDGCENPEMDCFENMLAACPSCNINKHSGSVENFRDLIANFIKSLNSYSVQYAIAKRYGLVVEVEKPVVFYFETINIENV